MDALEKILAKLQLLEIELQLLIDFKTKSNSTVVAAVSANPKLFKPEPNKTPIEDLKISHAALEEAINTIIQYRNEFLLPKKTT